MASPAFKGSGLLLWGGQAGISDNLAHQVHGDIEAIETSVFSSFRRWPCFKSTEISDRSNRSNIRLRQLNRLMFSISPSILFDGNMLSLRLQSL
jgi:hypothetical protein